MYIQIHLCINSHVCFMSMCKNINIYIYIRVHSAVSVYTSASKRIICHAIYYALLSLCHVFRQNTDQTTVNPKHPELCNIEAFIIIR